MENEKDSDRIVDERKVLQTLSDAIVEQLGKKVIAVALEEGIVLADNEKYISLIIYIKDQPRLEFGYMRDNLKFVCRQQFRELNKEIGVTCKDIPDCLNLIQMWIEHPQKNSLKATA